MKSKNDSPIGARIRTAFKEADNLTIGKMLGRSASTMTAIMSGDNPPSIQVLQLIRELTGYSIEWIVYEEGPEKVLDLKRVAGMSVAKEIEEAIDSYRGSLLKAIAKGDLVERKKKKAS